MRPKPNGINVNNLLYPNIINKLKQFQEQISCLTLNCRAAVNKDVLVGQYLREEKSDFALLTATWYSDATPNQFETSDVNQNVNVNQSLKTKWKAY